MVFPVGLALLRASHCRVYPGVGSALFVDNSISCTSSQAMLLTVLGALTSLTFALGKPAYVLDSLTCPFSMSR